MKFDILFYYHYVSSGNVSSGFKWAAKSHKCMRESPHYPNFRVVDNQSNRKKQRYKILVTKK